MVATALTVCYLIIQHFDIKINSNVQLKVMITICFCRDSTAVIRIAYAKYQLKVS